MKILTDDRYKSCAHCNASFPIVQIYCETQTFVMLVCIECLEVANNNGWVEKYINQLPYLKKLYEDPMCGEEAKQRIMAKMLAGKYES